MSSRANDLTSAAARYEDATYTEALTGITDENGERFASWGYDAQGRAIFSLHTDGIERVDFTRLADDTVVVDDVSGASRTFSFVDVNGDNRAAHVNVTGCTGAGCAPLQSSFAYDEAGMLSAVTNENAVETRFEYNGLGERTCQIEAYGTPAARMTRTQWMPELRLETEQALHEPGSTSSVSPESCAAALADWQAIGVEQFAYDGAQLVSRVRQDLR